MGKGGCINPNPISSETKDSFIDEDASIDKTSLTTKKITYAELSSKNTINECWIAFDSTVYDATHWLIKHPGGIRSIMSAAGTDASAVMKSLHTPKTLEVYMKRMRKVGVLVKYDDDDHVDNSKKDDELVDVNKQALERKQAIERDFNLLNERLVNEGWYDPQPWRYIFTAIRIGAMLLGGITLIKFANDSANDSKIAKIVLTTAGSMLIGFYFQNVAFSGHDAGHGSITGSFAIDNIIGLIIGNLLTGIDMGWWKSTHYVHHSATNSLHDDPDIQHMPLLCLDERMKDNRWSTYHGKYMLLDKIALTLLPYQHLYFYPVLGVARINLYIQSVIYLIKTCPFVGICKTKAGTAFVDEKTGQVKEKYAWPTQKPLMWTASFASLIIFYKIMLQFYLSLGLITGTYSFLITHIAAGLLHVQILLSHICMHYCEDGPGTTGAITAPNGHNETGYHEWQALSTMDIKCPQWMDWFHGGLQFQLEHHIFPRVPRWNLRKLCKLTDEIYAKYDVPVVRMSFVEANRMMLKHMRDVGIKVAGKDSLANKVKSA